jgi:hypothetical protein
MAASMLTVATLSSTAVVAAHAHDLPAAAGAVGGLLHDWQAALPAALGGGAHVDPAVAAEAATTFQQLFYTAFVSTDLLLFVELLALQVRPAARGWGRGGCRVQAAAATPPVSNGVRTVFERDRARAARADAAPLPPRPGPTERVRDGRGAHLQLGARGGRPHGLHVPGRALGRVGLGRRRRNPRGLDADAALGRQVGARRRRLRGRRRAGRGGGGRRRGAAVVPQIDSVGPLPPPIGGLALSPLVLVSARGRPAS